MTVKPPKLRTKFAKAMAKAAKLQRREAPKPLTIGDILGAEILADRAAKQRRADLDALGFTPVKGA